MSRQRLRVMSRQRLRVIGMSRQRRAKSRSPPRRRMSPRLRRSPMLPTLHRPRDRRLRVIPDRTPRTQTQRPLPARMVPATRTNPPTQAPRPTRTIPPTQVLPTPRIPWAKTVTGDPTATTSAGGNTVTEPSLRSPTPAGSGERKQQPRPGCAPRASGTTPTAGSSVFRARLRSPWRSVPRTSGSRWRRAATSRPR